MVKREGEREGVREGGWEVVEGVANSGGVHATEFPEGSFSSRCCSLKACLTGFPCSGLDGDGKNFLFRTLRLNPFTRGSP